MMTSTAAKARAQRLEKMARGAITQYNADMKDGGEPLFPDWALEMLGLIADYDRMVLALSKTRMHPVTCVDFETGIKRDSIVQLHPAGASCGG